MIKTSASDTNWSLHRIDLLSAIQYGCIEHVKKALEQDTSVNVPRGKLMPLQTSAMIGDIEIMKLLIRHGAKVDRVDGYGRTALHYAGETDLRAVEILLRENGADPQITDATGATALHWAAYKAKTECVCCLLQHGADVNSRNHNGETALFWAVRKTALEVVKLLLDYNIDPTIVNDRGETAVQKTWFLYDMNYDSDDDIVILDLLSQAMPNLPWNDLQQKNLLKAMSANESSQLSELRSILQTGDTISLKRICRYKIRLYMGKVFLPDNVRQLPIPQKLKDYLLVKASNIT